MGTQYFIGCFDCQVYRDLKFLFNCIRTPQTRTEALLYDRGEIQEHTFQYGLLVSFLLDHAAHHCQFFSEHDPEETTEHNGDHILYINDIALYPEKVDFWTKQSHENRQDYRIGDTINVKELLPGVYQKYLQDMGIWENTFQDSHEEEVELRTFSFENMRFADAIFWKKFHLAFPGTEGFRWKLDEVTGIAKIIQPEYSCNLISIL